MAIIGIDFGYSAIRVAIFKANKEVDIVRHENGDHFMSPVVAFDFKNRLFGSDALDPNYSPQAAMYGIKRIIGNNLSGQEAEEHLRNYGYRYSYNLNYFQDGKIKVHNERFTDTFCREEILAMIFDNIKEITEKYLKDILNYSLEVKEAVISVPAYFTHNQRQAIMTAAQVAGVKVLKLLNDTTAVAVNTSLGATDEKKVLIFSFGASAIEASVIEMNKSTISVISTAGSTSLGGIDLDELLLDYCVNEFEKKCITLSEHEVHKLRKQCESAKIQLQGQKSKSVIGINTSRGYQSVNVSVNDFHEICGVLIDKALYYVKIALRDSDCSVTQIDNVYLVGGSSRLKMIETEIEKMFKDTDAKITKLKSKEDIAKGCAIVAEKLKEKLYYSELRNLKVVDITPYNVALKQDSLHSQITVLVSRDSKLSHDQSVLLSLKTDLDSDSLSMFASVDVVIGDSACVSKFSKLMTIRFKTSIKTQTAIEIHLIIDENGIFSFSASELNEINEKKIEVLLPGNGFNIDSARSKLLKYKEDVKKEEIRIAAKNEFESEFLSVKQKFNKKKEHLLTDDCEMLSKRMDTIIKWYYEFEDTITENEFKWKQYDLKQLKNDINECHSEAEKRKTLWSGILKTRADEIDTKIAEIAMDANIKTSLRLIIKSLKDFNDSNSEKTVIQFNEKLKDSTQTSKTIDELYSDVQLKRGNRRKQLLIELQKMLEESPLHNYKNLEMFSTYATELRKEVTSFQIFLGQCKTLTYKEMDEKYKYLNNKIAYFNQKLNDDQSERLQIKNEIESVVKQLESLITVYDGSYLTADANKEITTTLESINDFCANLDITATKDMRSKLTEAKLIYSRINAPIEKEIERHRMLVDINAQVDTFWQSVEKPEAKNKLNEKQKKQIEKMVDDLKDWCVINTEASIDAIQNKNESIKELHEEYQKYVTENENKPVFVGVDFGTANSCISVINDEQFQTIEMEDGCIIPSVVTLANPVLIGVKAKKFIGSANTIFDVKLLLGKETNNVFKEQVRLLPYDIDTDFLRPKIVIKCSDRSKTERLNAEEVAALILKKLKLSAEYRLRKKLDSVSITVPANHCATQRQATYDAARCAGFTKVNLVNDNIALLLFHINSLCLKNTSRRKMHVVAISMGAAYFNVTIAAVENNCIEICRIWNERIGERDFDRKCHDYLFSYKETRNSENLRSRLLLICDEARKKLSSDDICEIKVENNWKHFLQKDVNSFTQDEYESACARLTTQIQQVVSKAINEATSLSTEVHVAVTGFAKKLPVIHDLLGKMKHYYYNDEDLSQGAAIYSAHMKNDPNNSVTLRNITPFRYKIEIKNMPPKFIEAHTRLPYERIIEIPCNNVWQETIDIKVHEGEKGKQNDTMIYNVSYKFKTIPKKGSIAAKIILKIDDSGLLHLSTFDGQSRERRLWNLLHALPIQEIEKITERCNKRLNSLMIEKNIAQKQLRDYVNGYISILPDMKFEANKFDVERLQKNLHSTLDWLNTDHTTSEINEKQKKIELLIHQILGYTHAMQSARYS